MLSILGWISDNWVWLSCFAATGAFAFLLTFKLNGGWQALAVAGVAMFLFFGAHQLDVMRMHQELNDAVAKQIKADNAACTKAKNTTKEVARALHKQISDLNTDLANTKQLRGDVCIVPIAGPVGRNDGTATAKEPVRENGIYASALYDFAAEAEQYRLKLIAWQDFWYRIVESNK